jgi:hypothetical protein
MATIINCTACAKTFEVQEQSLEQIRCLQCGATAIPTLEAIWNRMWASSVLEDGFVATVEPSDMKAVLRMGRAGLPTGREERQAMAQAAGSGPAIATSVFRSVCSPGADVTAVWYRVAMLGTCDEEGLLSAHKHDGEFTDAVFQVAAKFPMKRVEADAEYEGPPFDTEEFLKQVERASAE